MVWCIRSPMLAHLPHSATRPQWCGAFPLLCFDTLLTVLRDCHGVMHSLSYFRTRKKLLSLLGDRVGTCCRGRGTRCRLGKVATSEAPPGKTAMEEMFRTFAITSLLTNWMQSLLFFLFFFFVSF